MSIKKLFDSANKNTNFSDYANEKEKYEFVESSENAKQINQLILLNTALRITFIKVLLLEFQNIIHMTVLMQKRMIFIMAY
jgi:hypothetical protein